MMKMVLPSRLVFWAGQSKAELYDLRLVCLSMATRLSDLGKVRLDYNGKNNMRHVVQNV